MTAHFYENWLELRHQAQDPDGLDRTTALAIRDAVDAIEDYANEGGIGVEALDAIEAVEEYLRAVWPT